MVKVFSHYWIIKATVEPMDNGKQVQHKKRIKESSSANENIKASLKKKRNKTKKKLYLLFLHEEDKQIKQSRLKKKIIHMYIFKLWTNGTLTIFKRVY